MSLKTRVRPVALFAAITTLAAVAAIAAAGPLDPPAGPITPSYKTLADVEPRIPISTATTPGDADSVFRITQRGSYYLTGSFTGSVGKSGIEIASAGVTLDLNGFDLFGIEGSLDGIVVVGAFRPDIVIRNGNVRSWGGDGIDLAEASARTSSIIDVHASGNTGAGIKGGDVATISRCKAYLNGGNGIAAGPGGAITECTAYTNSTLGIFADNASTITNCVARENAQSGIATADSCTLIACGAYDNGTHGIGTGAGSTVNACTAASNDATGIVTGFGCTVSDCTARANAGNGISASGGAVSNCTALNNLSNGIAIGSQCHVRNNTCIGNGSGSVIGAGIYASSGDNRIEGNVCNSADYGIEVGGAGNIIIRNTCASNTLNWSITSGNVCGPVIDRTSPGSTAIIGNSGPDSTGTTHPNANFTY